MSIHVSCAELYPQFCLWLKPSHDVVTDPNALSLPSHIAPEMVAGFALTFGKLILSCHIDEVVNTIEGNIRHAGEALDTL